MEENRLIYVMQYHLLVNPSPLLHIEQNSFKNWGNDDLELFFIHTYSVKDEISYNGQWWSGQQVIIKLKDDAHYYDGNLGNEKALLDKEYGGSLFIKYKHEFRWGD